MLVEEIDGGPPALHALAPFLSEGGFVAGALGYQATFRSHQSAAPRTTTPVRPGKSAVSSPFARRVFTQDEEDEAT
jgi:hypothetical protein